MRIPLRTLSIVSVLVANPAVAAEDLTVTASLSFEVTSPLPAQEDGLVSGAGSVELSCSPCANPADGHKYSFKDVLFLHEQDPKETSPAVTISGTYTTERESSYPWTTTRLPMGIRVFPRLRSARCFCGNGSQSSAAVSVDRPAFTIPPFLNTPSRVTATDAAGQTHPVSAIPAGIEVSWRPSCVATPKGAERIRLHLVGAGVDLTRDSATSEEARQPLAFRPTAPGALSVTCSLEPYAASSNPVTFTVVGSASSPVDTGADGSGEQGGCAAVPGLGLLGVGLFASGLSRRRVRG